MSKCRDGEDPRAWVLDELADLKARYILRLKGVDVAPPDPLREWLRTYRECLGHPLCPKCGHRSLAFKGRGVLAPSYARDKLACEKPFCGWGWADLDYV